jgi:hypothetical protein
MVYLLVYQHVSGIIMPIIRRGFMKPIPTSAHRTTSSPRVYCRTASAVHHRRCRFCTVLLMMGMVMPETCWDTNKYIIFLHLVGYLFTLTIFTFTWSCIVKCPYNKINQIHVHYFLKFILEWNSTCFGQFLCPSSGVFHCTHNNGVRHTILQTACEQGQEGISQIYSWNENPNVWDSSSVHHQEFFTVHTAMVYVIQFCRQLASRVRMEFLKFIVGMKLYMFRTVPLSIIRSFSLYTQQWCTSYNFADSLRAGSGWNFSNLLLEW